MILLYGRPMCLGCVNAKKRLRKAGIEFVECTFDPDDLAEGGLVGRTAFAMYHYQDEMLPVLVRVEAGKKPQGITLEEVLADAET